MENFQFQGPRNYWLHIIEAGLFMGGVHFVSVNTVLPNLIRDLGGSNFFISIVPSLLLLGFLIPPIFVAHLLENRARYMPLILVLTVFQRLPYLLTGFILWFHDYFSNIIILFSVALCPLFSGLFGGFSLSGWLMVINKTIKPERLSSSVAFRYLFSAIIGVFAGWTVKQILTQYEPFKAYAILHFITFAFLFIGYFFLAGIKEPTAETKPQKKRKIKDTFIKIPTILNSSKKIISY